MSRIAARIVPPPLIAMPSPLDIAVLSVWMLAVVAIALGVCRLACRDRWDR